MSSQQSNTDAKRETGNGYQYIGLLLVGIVFVLVSGVKLTLTGIHTNNAVATEGTVIGVSKEVNVASGGDLDTYLTVEFSTGDGELIQFKDRGPSAVVGDKVEVLYNPENQSEARIRDFWQLWGVLSLFLVGGAAIIGWSLCKIISNRAA